MVSEHAVQLDANFEKYGYSAHLSKSMSRFYGCHWPCGCLNFWEELGRLRIQTKEEEHRF
jgi:hypothetical protein